MQDKFHPEILTGSSAFPWVWVSTRVVWVKQAIIQLYALKSWDTFKITISDS